MISVIAKIDRSSRARLSWIQSFAASFGIVPRPIDGTIALAELPDRDSAVACKEALAGWGAVSVDFEKVEVLAEPKAVAALAAHEGALAELRRRIVPDGTDWVPCIVLLQDNLVNLNWVRMAMTEMFQPFTAKVERIEFLDGRQVLDAIDLKGEDV